MTASPSNGSSGTPGCCFKQPSHVNDFQLPAVFPAAKNVGNHDHGDTAMAGTLRNTYNSPSFSIIAN